LRFKHAVLSAALAAAGLGVVSPPATAQDKKPYVIYLSNNFVGNDWRQQMERTANVAVTKGPLAGRVELHIENAESTVQAQITSLNNIIRAKPDAILIDAASDSALNPTVKRACDAGILVISFDQPVTEPCAYSFLADWNQIPAMMAEWMAHRLNGKGNVLVDRGLPGAPISAQIQSGFENVLKKYPDIKIVGNFNGEYALGPEQAGVAALLAANPQVDGVLTQGYGSGAIQALKDAGRPIVPVAGFTYNVSAVTCLQTEGASCFLASSPAYISAEVLKLAVQILDGGEKPATRDVEMPTAYLSTDPMPSELYPNATVRKIVLGETAFPDQPPGLYLPVGPDWIDITAAEASGTK
jgi:ribose transport system substrate-binding protein